jgi:cysteine synthase
MTGLDTVHDLTGLIGWTPLLELERLFPDTGARVLAKMELLNPMSIKDRPVLEMIRSAMADGRITTKTEVVEASSGNTAIAIASLGAVLGFKVRVFMSELCSRERQQILCAYGAKVVITPGEEHTKGARSRAIRYCEEHPDSTFFTNQHGNPDNGRAHELTTGPEIWDQTGGEKGTIGAVVIGLGTSGTFDGLSRFLKSMDPGIRIVGMEPAASPVYSGGEQGKHRIIGIGPGFVTENFQRSRHNLDEIVLVKDDDAFGMVREIAKTEGVLVGPTSGASAWVAGELANRRSMAGKMIICFFYDTGERYLSTPDLFRMDGIERME